MNCNTPSNRRVATLVILYCRLVMEDEATTLYYTLQNSKVYQEKELLGIQIHQDVSSLTLHLNLQLHSSLYHQDALAVDYLINAYPHFTIISELPIEDGTDDDKVVNTPICKNLTPYYTLITCTLLFIYTILQVNLCHNLYSQGLLLIDQ